MSPFLGSNEIYFLLSILLLVPPGLSNNYSDSLLNERSCPKSHFTTLPFWVEKLDPTIFDIITELLPEGQACSSNLLTKSQHFIFNEDNTYMNVTYIFSNTSSTNLFGYFVYNRSGDRTLQKYVIWPYLPNQKDENLNCVSLGDSVSIGPFNKSDSVGFWFQHIYQTSDNSYYSFLDPPYITNPDDSIHLVWVRLEHVNLTLFGFEDAHLLGDHDYNDIIWTVQTTPSTDMNGINICGRDCLAVCRDIGQILYSSYVTYQHYGWGLLDYGKSEISSYILIPNGWKIASKSDMTDEVITKYGHLWTYFHPNPCITISDSGTLRGYTLNNNPCEADSFHVINKYHPDCYTTNYQTRILLYKPAPSLEIVLNVSCEKNITKLVQKTPDSFVDRLLDPVHYEVKIHSFDNVILNSSFIPYTFGSLVADIIFLVDTVNIDYNDKLEIKKSAFSIIDLFESNGFLSSSIVSGIKISFAYYTGGSDDGKTCNIESEYKMCLSQDCVDKLLISLDQITSIKQDEPTNIISAAVNVLQRNIYSVGYGFKIIVILTNNNFNTDISLLEAQRNSNYAILIFNPSAEPNSSWIKLAASIIKPLYLGAVAFRKEKDYTKSIWENIFFHIVDPVVNMMTAIVPFSMSKNIQILSKISIIDLQNLSIYYINYSISIPSDTEYYDAEIKVAGYGETSIHVSKIPLPIAKSFLLTANFFSPLEFTIQNAEQLKDASIYKIFTLPDPECCTLNFNNTSVQKGAEFKLDTILSIIPKGVACKTDFNYSFFNNCTFGNIAMVSIEYYTPDLTIETRSVIKKMRLNPVNPKNDTIDLNSNDYINVDFNGINQSEIGTFKINVTVPPDFSECGKLFDLSSLSTQFTGGIIQDKLLFIPDTKLGERTCSFEYQVFYSFGKSDKAKVTYEVICAMFPPIIEINNTNFHKISTDTAEIPILITDYDAQYINEYVDIFASSENTMSQLIYYEQQTNTSLNDKLINRMQIPKINSLKLNLTWVSKKEEYEQVDFIIYAIDSNEFKSNEITLHMIAHPRSDPVIDFYPKNSVIDNIEEPYLLKFGATSLYDLETLKFKVLQLPDTGKLSFDGTNISIEADKYYGKESLSYIEYSDLPRLMIDVLYFPTMYSKEERISLVACDIHGFESSEISSIVKTSDTPKIEPLPESNTRTVILSANHYIKIDASVKVKNRHNYNNVVAKIINVRAACLIYVNNETDHVKNYSHHNNLNPLKLPCDPETKTITFDIVCKDKNMSPIQTSYGHIIYSICFGDDFCTEPIVFSITCIKIPTDYRNMTFTAMTNEIVEIYLPVYENSESIPINQKEIVSIVTASDNLFFADRSLTQEIKTIDHRVIKYPFVVYFSSLKSNTKDADMSTAELIYTYSYTAGNTSYTSSNFLWKMIINEEEDLNFKLKNGIKVFEPVENNYEVKEISLKVPGSTIYFDLSKLLGIDCYSDQVYIKIVSLPLSGSLQICVYNTTCNDLLKPTEIPYTIIGTPTYLKYAFIPCLIEDSDFFELATYTYDSKISTLAKVNFDLSEVAVIPSISSLSSSIKETAPNRYIVPLGSNITFDWTITNPNYHVSYSSTQISLRIYSPGSWKLYHCYSDSEFREKCEFKEIISGEKSTPNTKILVKPSYISGKYQDSDGRFNWWEVQDRINEQRNCTIGFRIRLLNEANNNTHETLMRISLQIKNVYGLSEAVNLYILSADTNNSITA